MATQTINPFCIIGIAVQTTNENGQSATDIAMLWQKFMEENMIEKIPGKIDNTIYCIYTSYEKDHTKPYLTILGCKVKNLDTIPEAMTGEMIKGGNYIKYTAEGNLQQGIVFNEWVKIWNSGIDRSYTADFEVYTEKALQQPNAAIDIFIAIN